MLHRSITFENFDGETVTEAYYFHLTKSELITMQADVEGGMEAALTKIIEAQDIKSLISTFKDIILTAYGVRSEDGKRFIKSPQLREEFSQTAAYDALFMELASDDKAAAEFVTGVIPKSLAEDVLKSEQNKEIHDKLSKLSGDVVEVPLPESEPEQLSLDQPTE